MYSCIVCGSLVKLPIQCLQCQAINYCGEDCRVKDLNINSDYSHRRWCDTLKTCMSASVKLLEFPFNFTTDTTSKSFTDIDYQKFLQGYGIFDVSLWRTESEYMSDSNPQIDDHLEDNPYGLSEGLNISLPLSRNHLITDWSSYYKIRQIPLTSPLCILLTSALTVYHLIVTHFVSVTDIPTSLRLHLLGVEKEIDLLYTFKELSHLLPETTIDIHMYGDKISPLIHGKSWSYNLLSVKALKGLYHDFTCEDDKKPDLAIGLNAGLMAFPEWTNTLLLLKEQNISAYFTEYCRYTAELSSLPIKSLSVGSISPISLNPFRSPVRVKCQEHNMPMFSNASIFSLVYDT